MIKGALRKAVFLDRDGVLNRSAVRAGRPYAPIDLAGFEILPEAPKAIRSLHDAGYLTIIITNQRDVGRGLISMETIDKMHQLLMQMMPIDDVLICTSVTDCFYYKPAPGMLLQAQKKWNISMPQSFMIGDRWRDVGAGFNAGCRTIFVNRSYAERLKHQPDFIVSDIAEAAELIIREFSIQA